MNCKNHQSREADRVCSFCGQPLCIECTVELNKRPYCRECLERHIESRPLAQNEKRHARKSKFLTFLLSFIPGAGHMYLGLINKGMSIMALYFGILCGTIFLSNIIQGHWLEGAIIPFASVLSVFYSIFDSLATAEAINSGKTVEDSSPVEFQILKEKVFGRKRTIGYFLIIIGFIGILGIINNALNYIIRVFFRGNLPFSLVDLVIPFGLILGGAYLIRKSRDSFE